MAAAELQRVTPSPHAGGLWDTESRKEESALFDFWKQSVSRSITSFHRSLRKHVLSLSSGPGVSKELGVPRPMGHSPKSRAFQSRGANRPKQLHYPEIS